MQVENNAVREDDYDDKESSANVDEANDDIIGCEQQGRSGLILEEWRHSHARIAQSPQTSQLADYT